MEKLRGALRWLLATIMVAAGTAHFAIPEPFLRIVPPYLPWPTLLVAASGALEIALGIVLVIPTLRVVAGWGLIALYVAVFPANLHQAMNAISFSDEPISPWLLWGRLPLQLVFIALAYWVSRPERDTQDGHAGDHAGAEGS